MRRLALAFLALGLFASLLVLPLAAQAAPCDDCLHGAGEADCQPGNPSCGCCLWALPLTGAEPVPEPGFHPQAAVLGTLQLFGSVDLDGILHVPRR